ncbi:hypothetical protein D5R40_34840, partial [Okeania hirsuta]
QLRWAAVLPYGLLLFFSVVATKDYLNWNRARAAAYAWLHQEGISIEQMDAGYEYNGWYNYHRDPIQADGRSFWWVTDEDYLITFGLCKDIDPFKYSPIIGTSGGKRIKYGTAKGKVRAVPYF